MMAEKLTKNKNEMPQLPKKNILLAEDDQLVSQLTKRMLEIQNYNVFHVENGKDCIHMLSRFPPGFFHLILMDISMPLLDGLSAAFLIRNFMPQEKSIIPIIAYTSEDYGHIEQEILLSGINDYVAKPASKHTLLSAVQRWI